MFGLPIDVHLSFAAGSNAVGMAHACAEAPFTLTLEFCWRLFVFVPQIGAFSSKFYPNIRSFLARCFILPLALMLELLLRVCEQRRSRAVSIA